MLLSGAAPKNLDLFKGASDDVKERISVYRNIADFEELHDILKKSRAVAIIGGGFLGSELACALARMCKKAVYLFIYIVIHKVVFLDSEPIDIVQNYLI